MRHLAAKSLVLVTLLTGCGQKGPLVLPDAAKHKAVPAVPTASPLPATKGQPAQPPASPPASPTP